MKHLTYIRQKLITYISQRPKSIIVLSCVVSLLAFVPFEFMRASRYIATVEKYRNSPQVLGVKTSAEELNIGTDVQATAAYCDVDITRFTKDSDSEVGQLVPPGREIYLRAEEAIPSPAFDSVFAFLPRIREAHDESEEISRALEKIRELTSEDARSTYCFGLVSVLGELYFLKDIQTPQGVGALVVGQLESFQLHVRNAQQKLAKTIPPQVFYDEHRALVESLNQLALDVRTNENDEQEFSRRVENTVTTIQDTLGALRFKSKDLLTRFDQVDLYADILVRD